MATEMILGNSIPSEYYVADVQKHRLLLRCLGEHPPKEPPPLNAQVAMSDPKLWIISTETKHDLVAALSSLRDLNVPLLETPAGWPPSAVFEQLREDGEICGCFVSVTFVGANCPRFQEGR